MRRLLLVLAFSAALPALAQQGPKLEPIPEPPPPPPGLADTAEPQVTITKRGEERVEEYRMNGKLYMLKVTPPHGGTPYYLIDEKGNGTWTRQDGPNSSLSVPMWVIGNF